MSIFKRKHRKRVAKFIKKYTVLWSVVTVIFYALAIPATIWVFPSTTLLLTIFVLFGGFTASVAALGSAIVTAEEDDTMQDKGMTNNDTEDHDIP